MKIKILYEDKDVLAIDKPSGIAVHSDGQNKEKTIADWIIDKYPKMKNVGESSPAKDVYHERKTSLLVERPGIVHRLDKDTSGVLVLAKNQKSYESLKNQFRNREVKKTYCAIVSGFLKNDRGIINKPIGRSPLDFRRKLAGRGARGELKEALTQYKVLKRFTLRIANVAHKFSYLEVFPKTGRTHQIRVHLKFLNHPIVCDSLYNHNEICPVALSRLALHSRSIEFKDLKGKMIKVESPLPKTMKEFIK
jgi:23S rRNA pseudouridine1911/1915/1917 synthase